jgi:hypothetical protein
MTELTEGQKIAFAWKGQTLDDEGCIALARQIDRGINEGPEWFPISSAPRDGTPILVWLSEKHLGSHVHSACFRPNVLIIGGHFAFDVSAPSHWMNQPGPPAEA